MEMLLAVATIALLAALSVPFYRSFQVSTQSDVVVFEIAQSMHRAKLKAMAAENDDSWSVAIGDDSKITLFKGTIYASRDQQYDETYDLPPTITIAEGNKLTTFSKFSATPNQSGTISVTDSNGKTKNIIINTRGTVDY